MSRRFDAVRIAVILGTVSVTTLGVVSPASAHGSTHVVQAGQSIQGAIDAAQSGDRILVQAGTYPEQLTISKDGIDLIGLGAVLVPPVAPTPNTCTGLAGDKPAGTPTVAGICVTGEDVVLKDFEAEHRRFVSVGSRVQDVTVTGFQVRGFSGENVAVVGAKGARVFGNRFADGPTYGFLTVGSIDTRVTANTVSSSSPVLGFIAICMDNAGGVQVTANHISGYNVGLCVQTAGAQVRGNDVRATCIGAFVDPGIDGAQILANHIGATNPLCKTQNLFGNFGIIVDGAVNTLVQGNRIEGQTNFGKKDVLTAGVAVTDGETGTVGSGNTVVRNILRNNTVDVAVVATGSGNVVTHNVCRTSVPDGLCG